MVKTITVEINTETNQQSINITGVWHPIELRNIFRSLDIQARANMQIPTSPNKITQG